MICIKPDTILLKGTKIVTVKASKRSKAHKRKVKSSDKISDIKLRDGINNMDMIKEIKTDKDIKNLLGDSDWNIQAGKLFNPVFKCRHSIIHVENNKIYAMSTLQTTGRNLHIGTLEVNPSKQRRGYGIKAMRDVINVIIDSDDFDKIELTSLNSNSDKFYDAIGMVRTNSKDDYQAEYEGNKQWMKKFIKSI